jgi:hypothetical protein
MNFWYYCCVGYVVISILFWLFSLHTYFFNHTRASGEYDPLAILLVPITWPFLLFGGFIVTVLKAILFGVFLLVFSLAAAVIRKPFFWPWIEPGILGIGRRLLKANTFLIRLLDRDS